MDVQPAHTQAVTAVSCDSYLIKRVKFPSYVRMHRTDIAGDYKARNIVHRIMKIV